MLKKWFKWWKKGEAGFSIGIQKPWDACHFRANTLKFPCCHTLGSWFPFAHGANIHVKSCSIFFTRIATLRVHFIPSTLNAEWSNLLLIKDGPSRLVPWGGPPSLREQKWVGGEWVLCWISCLERCWASLPVSYDPSNGMGVSCHTTLVRAANIPTPRSSFPGGGWGGWPQIQSIHITYIYYGYLEFQWCKFT